MFRFLHTSDWQLGMTRHFLSEGAQERFGQARFDSIRKMGQIAKQENCEFMLVCGDIFESNQVDRKTVARALEALKEVPVPVFILPGNHDPLNSASVYNSSTFIERKPEHVHVVETSTPITLREGVELVGGAWVSKRPAVNPIEEVLANLAPAGKAIRICMAHGIVDLFAPDSEAPGVIALRMLENAISEGKIHFVALGDRHSLTRVGSGERIWYSGAPETTDFSEIKSGYAQVVELDQSIVSTKEVQIGQWQFVEFSRVDLNGPQDIEALRKSLESIERKELTLIKLKLFGSLSLSARDTLQNTLFAIKDVFASLDVREDNLLILPEDTDFVNLGFFGFADACVEQLRAKMESGSEDALLVRDAMMLLLRLAKEGA